MPASHRDLKAAAGNRVVGQMTYGPLSSCDIRYGPSSQERRGVMASNDLSEIPAVVEEAPSTKSRMEEVSGELLVEEVSIDGMCGVY